MSVTTIEAAALTGKSRSTIWRACKLGRVSASKNDAGDLLIDPAELERVFGTLKPRNLSQTVALKPTATDDATSASQLEAQLMREAIERERNLYERDRATWDDERTFLRGMLEKQSEQVRLLTDQRADRSSRSWPPEWWRRLRG